MSVSHSCKFNIIFKKSITFNYIGFFWVLSKIYFRFKEFISKNWIALYGTGLTSIKIPKNVTSIGSNAFSCCSKLSSVNIPEGISSIESRLAGALI